MMSLVAYASDSSGDDEVRDDSAALDSILDIQVPYDLPFMIDPIERSGNGQVYSETFRIDNYGGTDVYVHFTSIQYIFANGEDFFSLDEPFDVDKESPLKELYMTLEYENHDRSPFVIRDFEQAELEPILLEAAEYDDDGNFIALRENSTVRFHFSGSVNHAPLEPWASGDVKVSIRYSIEELDNSEEPNIIEEADDTQTQEADELLTEDTESGQDETPAESPETNDKTQSSTEAAGQETSESIAPDDTESESMTGSEHHDGVIQELIELAPESSPEQEESSA